MVSEFPPFVYGEALVDPHEDVVVVDDFVRAGKDGYSFEGGFAFQDFEFSHIPPGFEVVAAQDAADGDVCAHKLVPHGLRHAFQGGKRPCVDEDSLSGIEPDSPVVDLTAFFYPQEGSHLPVRADYILGFGFYSHRFPGHYLKEKGH